MHIKFLSFKNHWILKHCYIEDRQEFENAIAALVRTLTNQHAPEMFGTYKKRRATGNVSREFQNFQSIEKKVRDRVYHHMWTLEYSAEEEQTLFTTLLNSGQFAMKATDLIDQGIVEAIRVQDLLQHDDAQSTNIGIDGEGRVVVVDFERYLWPMTCQNFGFALDDCYQVGDSKVPVLRSGEQNAESIRQLTFANPYKRASLQQSSERLYLDLTGLDENPKAQRRNIKLYLRFILLPKSYFIQVAKSYIGSAEWQASFVRYLEQHQSNLRSICLGMTEFDLKQPECCAIKDEILEEFRTIPDINCSEVQDQWNILVALVGKPLPEPKIIREAIASPEPSRDEQADLAYCLKLKKYIEQHEWQLGWQRPSHRYFIIVEGQQKRVPTHVYSQYQRLLNILESEFDLAQEKRVIQSMASTAHAQRLHFFRRADTRNFYRDCAADTLDFQVLDPNNIAARTIQVY